MSRCKIDSKKIVETVRGLGYTLQLKSSYDPKAASGSIKDDHQSVANLKHRKFQGVTP